VTARRLANAGVQEGEARLRMALAAAQAGVWALEVKTGAATWSPENSALYGYEPAGAPPTDWWERLHPDDRARTQTAFADALAGRAPEFRSEFRVAHPTRGDRWLLGLGRVELSDTGEAVRLIGINLDITDRKRAEQLLAEQDVRKDEFLATLAHELRNPLAPIRSGVAVLRMTAGPQQTEKTLGMIDRQLGHMVNLVDDLLDVSRVRSGKLTLRTERVLLRDAVDGAVEACQSTLDAKLHTLKTTFPAQPVVLLGDKTRLVQVVANLLTNAAKYSEPGGHIRIAVERDGGEAVIRVADSGVGISREVLPTVWDMFTQVRDTLDKAQGGLGIGLSLVKKLVLAHGGTVAAESEGVGRGSTFTVRLPVAPVEPVSTVHPESVALPPRPSALRVLVVDDNMDGAEMLVMLLQRCGHVTQMAHTGPEALTAAGAFAPDVTFLDIGLPEMDGYEVARRLRADPVTSRTVLIALTGWGSEDDKRKSREAGFDVHLTKPVDAGVVKGVLAQYSARGAAAVR
jgi:PAS domain S-box-containing protein